MSIVRAKLIPPSRQADIVERERLITKLADVWQKPLGLIVAPAGFGKTTLALSWMARQHQRVAWLTLDDADNDIDRFLTYVLLAIASAVPRADENTRALAERSSRPTTRELAETLADDLMDTEEEFCLVLDESGHLNSIEAWDFLECLIRLAPPRFHLLVLSRVDPPLPLTRLRIRGQIVELRGTELLLSFEQIKQVFAARDIELEDLATREIEQATHGWPAGVRLALVQAMTSGEPRLPREDSSAVPSGFVLDPLADMLIDHLPSDAGEALLIASLMKDLTPELLQALIGPEPSTTGFVEDFTRAGILIRSTERGGGWVRLHPLFRDLFGRQLNSRRTRAQVKAWHRTAANWFESEGDVESAIRHFTAAGDFNMVVRLLDAEIPRAIDREAWGAVSDWLDQVSDDVIVRSPVLALGRLWVLFFKGSWLAMRETHADVRRLIEGLPIDTPQRSSWLAELDILKAHERTPFDGDAADTLTIVEQAVPYVDPNRRFVMGHTVYLRGTTLEVLGRSQEADAAITGAIGWAGTRVDSAMLRPLIARCFILRQRGAIPQLDVAASDVAVLADSHDLPVSRGWGRLFHAYVLFQRNDLAAAEPILADLVDDFRRIHVACLLEGMLLLARTYWVQGHSMESTAVIRRLREKLAIRGSVELLPLVSSFELFLTYLESPETAVGEFLPDRSDSVLDVTPHFLHHPLTATVLVDSAAGGHRAERALFLAETYAERTVAIHFTCWQPEVFALRAIALSALGRDVEAVASMRAALAQPATKYLTRTLLDLGPRARDLYRSLIDDAGVGSIARALIHGPEPEKLAPVAIESDRSHPAPLPRARQTSLLSLLTDRELTVLELLARRLSYKEIGGSLYISPLTVKRHAGNIYDKLGVNCRRDAVLAARDLGWSAGSDSA